MRSRAKFARVFARVMFGGDEGGLKGPALSGPFHPLATAEGGLAGWTQSRQFWLGRNEAGWEESDGIGGDRKCRDSRVSLRGQGRDIAMIITDPANLTLYEEIQSHENGPDERYHARLGPSELWVDPEEWNPPALDTEHGGRHADHEAVASFAARALQRYVDERDGTERDLGPLDPEDEEMCETHFLLDSGEKSEISDGKAIHFPEAFHALEVLRQMPPKEAVRHHEVVAKLLSHTPAGTYKNPVLDACDLRAYAIQTLAAMGPQAVAEHFDEIVAPTSVAMRDACAAHLRSPEYIKNCGRSRDAEYFLGAWAVRVGECTEAMWIALSCLEPEHLLALEARGGMSVEAIADRGFSVERDMDEAVRIACAVTRGVDRARMRIYSSAEDLHVPHRSDASRAALVRAVEEEADQADLVGRQLDGAFDARSEARIAFTGCREAAIAKNEQLATVDASEVEATIAAFDALKTKLEEAKATYEAADEGVTAAQAAWTEAIGRLKAATAAVDCADVHHLSPGVVLDPCSRLSTFQPTSLPPWSTTTHVRYPAPARARAAELLLVGHQLARAGFIGQGDVKDVWVDGVMRFAVERRSRAGFSAAAVAASALADVAAAVAKREEAGEEEGEGDDEEAEEGRGIDDSGTMPRWADKAEQARVDAFPARRSKADDALAALKAEKAAKEEKKRQEEQARADSRKRQKLASSAARANGVSAGAGSSGSISDCACEVCGKKLKTPSGKAAHKQAVHGL